MRFAAKLGFVAVGLGLTLSVAACAIKGDDSESSADALFGRGNPNRGRPIGPPVTADEDASLDAVTGESLITDADAAVDEDASPDAEAPAIEEDAGGPPPADEDAGA